MADPFLGEIKMFAGTFAPRDWAFCDGRELVISEHDQLYLLLGNTWGGDGTTTFALPDLRGRVPLGDGSGPGLTPRVKGESGGAESVTLAASQLPQHSHAMRVVGDRSGHEVSPAGNLPARSFHVTPYVNEVPGGLFAADAVSPSGGGNQPHENRQPYLGMNFIIALVGAIPQDS